MSPKLFLAALALVASTALVTAEFVTAQEPGGGMDAAMAKMMELASPGEEHAALARKSGRWIQHHKMRMSPDAPWTDAEGTSEVRSLLGGRYVLEEFRFDAMGMPMEGIQIVGFDKLKNEYVALWMDSMSTWWITSRGKEREDGSIEFRGTMVDPSGERPFRSVVRAKGEDAVDVEMFDTVPGRGEFLMMSFTSTRNG